jgi:hypothetical protein
MTLSTSTEGASIAGTSDKNPQKSNIVLRAIIFISVHLAFVGAGVLIYSG